MNATIYKIDRLNTLNAAGYRTVLYFKGCPLHCTWCHNPEGIKQQKQVWVNHAKCIKCGLCVDVCVNGSLILKDDRVRVNQDTCLGCQACATVCPAEAMERIGSDYSVEEVMDVILQDKFLYEETGGGITVTGGEPALQADFITELFIRCKEEGIQTAFDTSGVVPLDTMEELLRNTDLLFFDLKIDDAAQLKEYTGLSKGQVERALDWLKNERDRFGFKLEFRTPLVPGVSDGDDNLKAFAELISSDFPEASWELCMFNDLCEDKYKRLSMPWPFSGKKHTKEDYEKMVGFRKKYNAIEVSISGFYDESCPETTP